MPAHESYSVLGFGPSDSDGSHDIRVISKDAEFQDVQESGPFLFWEHTHTVIGIGAEESLLRDHIEYEVPFGFILNGVVRRQLRKTFAYQHRVTAIHTT